MITFNSTNVSRDSMSVPTHNLTLNSSGGDDVATITTRLSTDLCNKNNPSELCNYLPRGPVLPSVKTRVVIQGFDGSIITAFVMGYSNDGLCHVLDKDSDKIFIIAEIFV